MRWSSDSSDVLKDKHKHICHNSVVHTVSTCHCVSQIFCAPSFDDKILEVVAVFGSMQMAVSRVIKLQHHRIAQVAHTQETIKRPRHIIISISNISRFLPYKCRTVKITILGDEGVPIQVDGEAWIQPPGVIKIQHKNRAQMLTRDRVRKKGYTGFNAQ